MVKVENVQPGIDFIRMERSNIISPYIIEGSDKRLMIESSFSAELKILLNGLKKLGLAIEDIDYFATTHVHLDHCGAVGHLCELNPDLMVYVHELGAKHLISPDKLNASAERAYGSDVFPMFGKIFPVPANQLITVKEGDEIDIGDKKIIVYYTPGHAKHHVCYFMEGEKILFTGELLGKISSHILSKQDYPLVEAAAPEYDPVALFKSIDKMRELKPKLLLFSHMGPAPQELNDTIFQKYKRENELFLKEIKAILQVNKELNGMEILERLKDKIPCVERFYRYNYSGFRWSCNAFKHYIIKNELIWPHPSKREVKTFYEE